MTRVVKLKENSPKPKLRSGELTLEFRGSTSRRLFLLLVCVLGEWLFAFKVLNTYFLLRLSHTGQLFPQSSRDACGVETALGFLVWEGAVTLARG